MEQQLTAGQPSALQIHECEGTSAGAETSEAKCRDKKWVRFCALRTAWKVLLAMAIWYALHSSELHLKEHMVNLKASLTALDLGTRILAFFAGSVPFTTLSPTGYVPTVLAGMVFDWKLAWAVSYTQVNVGAVCYYYIAITRSHTLFTVAVCY